MIVGEILRETPSAPLRQYLAPPAFASPALCARSHRDVFVSGQGPDGEPLDRVEARLEEESPLSRHGEANEKIRYLRRGFLDFPVSLAALSLARAAREGLGFFGMRAAYSLGSGRFAPATVQAVPGG